MDCRSCGEKLHTRMAVTGSVDWILLVCPWCFTSNYYSVIKHEIVEHGK